MGIYCCDGLPAVREFYEQAYRDCRLVYNNLASPRQIQTLVQGVAAVVEVALIPSTDHRPIDPRIAS